jgi:phospholipase/lecithinase/hemolysin
MTRLVLLAALAVSLSCASARASTYTTLFAFGDSLSDAGNLFIEDSGTLPVAPYYAGHFSNGPTWVEDLSVKLGLGTLTASLAGGNDFAFGGAQTGPTDINPANPLHTDLPGQIAAYALAHPTPVHGALYTLDIGSNDIINALGAYAAGRINLAEVEIVAAQAEANTVDAIDDLYALGARSLLFYGVPNLGHSPRFAGSPLQALASQLGLSFDATVLSDLGALELGGLDVFDLQPQALFDKIRLDPAAYGFTNVSDPCWTGNFTSSSSGTLCSPTLAGQDSYLFWDEGHPTAAGHLLIADVAYDTVTATPEPATWALLLIGSVGLGVARYGCPRVLKRAA